MRATKFEFKNRFWIIFAIYAIGFSLAGIDHTPFIVAVRHLIAPGIARGTAEADTFARIVISIGAVLVFLTAALRTWAASYLRTSVVHDTAQHSEALVADGPFRYTRNPFYFANLPMAAGIGVMASGLGWIIIVAANWLFVYRLIFREEEALQQSQGESYRAYCKAVPRFWPSLKPRLPAGNNRPQWGQAFIGESFVWLFGLAELCLAITLSVRLTVSVFVLGFIVHLIVRSLVMKKSSAI